MVSTCSMSTGHSSTHAPQVRHDHSTSGSMVPGTRVGASALAAAAAVAAVGVRPRASDGWAGGADQAGRGLEEVVAQPHDEQLRGQGLAGVPRRAHRLAPPALGAGEGVEQLLPGQVLDVAGAEHGVLGDVLHVHVGRVVERAQGPGPARGRHVDGGQGDVEVLGVGEEDEEADDDGDVEDEEHRLEIGVHARPEVGEEARRPRARRRATSELP